MPPLPSFVLLYSLFVVSLGSTPLRVTVHTSDGQTHAQEPLTFEVSGVSSSVYLYNFGDGTVVNHTCSKVTHRYTDSGRYTFSVLVTYGVNIYQQALSLAIQPKRGCYEFKLSSTYDITTDWSSNIIVLPGKMIPIYCYIADSTKECEPIDPTLTLSYSRLGETPTLIYDEASPFVLTPTMQFNSSIGAWEGTITAVGIAGTIEVLVSPKRIGVLGCYVRESVVTVTIAQFTASGIGATVNTSSLSDIIFQPVGLNPAQALCFASTSMWALGVPQGTEPYQGALLVVTDDTFGVASQVRDLLFPAPTGICFLEDKDCSAVTIYDVEILSDDNLLLLTSLGLVAGVTGYPSLSYNFSQIIIGVSYVDEGNFVPTSVRLITSNVCIYGAGYIYVSYTSSDSSGVLTSTAPNGQWTTLDSTTDQQVQYIGVIWLYETQQHLLLVSNTTATYTMACNNNSTSCSVGFTFPPGTYLTGMVWHSLGSDILVYGDGIWHCVAGSQVFNLLSSLAGETVTTLTSSNDDLGYAVLTNKNNVYYGKLPAADVIWIPTIEYSAPSSITFDDSGKLYMIVVDFSAAIACEDLSCSSGTQGMKRILLSVPAFISSSDYSVACPIAPMFRNDGSVAFYAMGTDACSFNSSTVGRTLKYDTGGSAVLYSSQGDQLVLGVIQDSFQFSPTTYPVMLQLQDAHPTPSIQIISGNWTTSVVGLTLTFRLGSIFISTFVNSTCVVGELVGCADNTVLCADWVALLSGLPVEYASADLLLNGIPGVKVYADSLQTIDNEHYWYIPAGEWSLYDFSSDKYTIAATCPYYSLSMDTSTRYLDIGETFAASFSITPSVDVQLMISNPDAITLELDTMESTNFNNVTIFVSGGSSMGTNSTIVVRPTSTSLACAMPGVSLLVVQGCNPTKQLNFVSPLTLASYSQQGTHKLPYVIDIPVNYRPPSAFGRAVPTSNNIYNADPSKPRYFDKFKISKTTGQYKQCKDKDSRAACSCATTQLISEFESDSDCIEVVLTVPWRQVYVPQLALNVGNNSVAGELWYTLKELNGRTDYCFSAPNLDCTSAPDIDNFVLSTTNMIGIQFSGAELFHFRATLQNPSYCSISTEFAVWAENPPLPQFIVWIVVSCAAIFIALLLYGGFLIYSYLYNSDQ